MTLNNFEINFDSIVGPTHNYSGLSYGNVASMDHQQLESNPRAAALQGLEKMWYCVKLGLKQAVLPPQERPHFPTLKALGYQGTEMVPSELLTALSSAACMWAANAATVTPSRDSSDFHVHITPANLTAKFHRSIEPYTTSRVLKQIFTDPNLFVHHPMLPAGATFSDEGAANHTRFCKGYGKPGIHLFVYGRSAFKNLAALPGKFPARQTLEASQAIARLHKLKPENVVFAQQSPEAIDAGVFHNDVISVGNNNVFLYHEQAFVDTDQVIRQIKKKGAEECAMEMIFIKVPENRISIENAVASYLFNSQIVTLPDGTMKLIAPSECEHMHAVKSFIDEMIGVNTNPINSVSYLNLHESMRNGGGPACLRLRCVLNEHELAAIHPYVLMTEGLYRTLTGWVERHYRTQLKPQDLADPKLHQESLDALKDLSDILRLELIYDY